MSVLLHAATKHRAVEHVEGGEQSVLEVARRVTISRPAVWRWQRRYAEAGVDGLLRDKTRPAGTAPVPMTTVAKVLALTSAEPPGETTHWTGRAMAAAVGLSLRTIQRIWEAHRLQPHRLRTFKRSKDPAFAEKVEDIVGLYTYKRHGTTTLVPSLKIRGFSL
jgi:transposase-like protein